MHGGCSSSLKCFLLNFKSCFSIFFLYLDEVTVKFKSEHSFAYNVKTGTTPVVVHGNGPIKVRHPQLVYPRYFILVIWFWHIYVMYSLLYFMILIWFKFPMRIIFCVSYSYFGTCIQSKFYLWIFYSRNLTDLQII